MLLPEDANSVYIANDPHPLKKGERNQIKTSFESDDRKKHETKNKIFSFCVTPKPFLGFYVRGLL